MKVNTAQRTVILCGSVALILSLIVVPVTAFVDGQQSCGLYGYRIIFDVIASDTYGEGVISYIYFPYLFAEIVVIALVTVGVCLFFSKN